MHVESLINNPTEAKVFRKVVKEIKVKKSMQSTSNLEVNQ